MLRCCVWSIFLPFAAFFHRPVSVCQCVNQVIWHLAALYNFNLTYQQLKSANVGGANVVLR